MTELVAGNRDSPVEQVSTSRAIFRRYISALNGLSFEGVVSALTDAERELRRRRRKRRGLISHSNWNEYSNPDAISNLRLPDRKRRRLPVANGWRVKEQTSEVPDYPLCAWSDTWVPLCWGPSGWLSDSRTIAYGVGSISEFHECSHSWTRNINSTYPFMGISPLTEFTVCGYVHKEYTIPGWRNSGYYKSLSTRVIPVTLDQFGSGSRYVRRASWPTRVVEPTQAQVEYARRMALASMYGGTPPTRPNFVRSLIELKDTKQTITGLVHFYKWGKALISDGCLWERVGRSMKRVTGLRAGRRSIGELAGAYLNYIFGIRPTLDDVKLFLDTIRNVGVRSLLAPQGQKASPGLVVTSHYQVRPERDALAMPSFAKTAQWQWIFTGSYHQQDISVQLSPRLKISRSELRKYPEILESRLSGCVFARIKQENSQYFWDNFGNVGTTWSYPAIETTWELLPWSWFIDWFTNARRRIQLAEREARTYWMRVGFEPPWVAEQTTVYRHLYAFNAKSTCYTDLKARWYEYYAEQCFAQIRDVVTLTPGPIIPVSRVFRRQPLEQGWPAGSFDGVPITVRTFQISVGMALVLNS